MQTSINPLIGASDHETVENVAEALRAALVLMADRHTGLCKLLMPVLNDLETEGAVADRNRIENAVEAFSAAIILMGDKHSGLCRLLMPVLNALEHVAITWEQPLRGATLANASARRKHKISGVIRPDLAGVDEINRASVMRALRA